MPLTGSHEPREDAGERRLILEFAKALGIGTAVLFMAGILLFRLSGIIRVDEDISLAARIVALLFAGVLLVIAFGIILSPVRILAEAHGARGWLSAAWIAVRHLPSRITLASVAAALLLAPLAFNYWRASTGAPPWATSRDVLIDLVLIEALLIHGFPFLVMASVPLRLPSRVPRIGCGLLVVMLVALYGGAAWNAGRWWGVLGLVYLMVPNILTFGHAATHWHVVLAAGARWMVKAIVLFTILIVLDARSLGGGTALRVGLYYFSASVLIELFRVIDLPFDLGAAWARLPERRRRLAR